MATGQGTATLRNSGVYEIVCRATGMRYVGSSINLKRRLKAHRRLLDKGVHHNAHLQNAVAKYGIDCFEIKVLAFLEYGETLSTEQRMLDKAAVDSEELFNKTTDALSPMRGKHHTDKAKALISARHVGNTYTKGRKATIEERKKLSEFQNKRYANPEERAKHSITMSRPEVSSVNAEKARERMEDPVKRKAISDGVKRYFEKSGSKERSSASQKARFQTEEGKIARRKLASLYDKPVECITLNTVFSSATEAAEMTGLNKSSVGRVCLGRWKQANGLVFKYVNGVEN